MNAHRLVLLLTLLGLAVTPARADTTRPNWAFHAIEGPFATLDEYCQRFARVDGTCAFEAADTPAPFGELRSIRIARVRSHKQLGIDWILLVVETKRGLFVDDRLSPDYAGLHGGDATLSSVWHAVSKNGRDSLWVRLSGHSGAPQLPEAERAKFIAPDGTYKELTICEDEPNGGVRCMDPFVDAP